MTVEQLPLKTGALAGERRVMRRLARAWHEAQRRRRIAATVRELDKLDNRMLKDVGVSGRTLTEFATAIEDGTMRG